jgi:hypothetical protein
MDDADFDQVPQILFANVSSLRKRGCPGTLIPLTHNTRAVLCGNDSNEVIVVATRFGDGRCLVFAHCDYPNSFLNGEVDDQNFVENCRQWLSRGENAQFESINDVSSMNDVQPDGKILVWNGHCTKDKAFMNDLMSCFSHRSFVEMCLWFYLVCLFATRWCAHLWMRCMGLVASK